ncbi:MAG: arginase family protein [Bacteroidales bacterium]|nr:arginase family protein [Bacteroidales bacterium]
MAIRSACAVVFPFDLFGNAGTGAGAQLLADVLQEAIDDTALETQPTRPQAYTKSLTIEEFPFETLHDVSQWRDTGRAAVRAARTEADFTLWLAGNHLGVLPLYEELGPDALVIQFDAHLDCYDLHDTTPELSHGNWLLHAQSALPKIVNVGHRDLFLKPKAIRNTFAAVFPAEELMTNMSEVLAQLRQLTAHAKQVWFDLDTDVLDPAFAPAVHQATPFGLTPQQLLSIMLALWSDRVVGVSVSEFDPGRDDRDRTLQLLGWLLERLLLRQAEASGKPSR